MSFQNITGDSLEVLQSLKPGSVDLFVMSPPFADARKKQYGGPHPDHFVDWFLPFSAAMKNALAPTGSIIINLKEKVVEGQRHLYVMKLVIAMVEQQQFLWTEEWCWHKKTCSPGKWPNRFRDAWERILQFNLQRKFKMNQEAVMVPIGDWSISRLKNLSDTDKIRDPSGTGSPFGKNVSNWVGKKLVNPSNVLYLSSETGNRQHPASYPESLPTFFIKLFTDEGDLVCDPFGGAGTSGVAAVRLNRSYMGIDLNPKYSDIAEKRITAIIRTPPPVQV